LKNGDLDGDGDVDGLDLTGFKNAYGSFEGDSEYNPHADFEGNGAVDDNDLYKFAIGFGKVEVN